MGAGPFSPEAQPALDWAAAGAGRASGRTVVLCVECGQEFTASRSDAVFCTRACAARARRRTVRRCAACRRPLTRTAQSNRRYCSATCRKRAHRRRQQDRGAAGGAS